MSQKQAAVFLDRDGTINIEKEYLYRIEDLELISGTGKAIALLNQAGYRVIVVSNQSGIGRGYYSEADVHHLHRHIDRVLAQDGAAVDAYYYCPHHPEHGQGEYRRECSCRKPLPGMILQAAQDLGINLATSFMVGDKSVDVQAGKAAGCTPILVRTGYGADEEQHLHDKVPVVDNLLAAAEMIIKRCQKHHTS